MKYNGLNTTVVKNGNTQDIMNALVAAVPIAVEQFKQVPTTYKTGNLIQDAKNACMYVRDRVNYKADGFQFQDIQMPGRMFNDTKQADCKSFSLASLANLLSKGYNGGFRFASYRPNKIPTHVYIYILDKSGNKFTFDPCIKNLKESPKATHIIDMDVRYLSEPPAEIYGREERQARRAARRERRQERREDRAERRAAGDKPKAVPKVALAPARGAFLGLLALNFRGLASRLNTAISKDSKKVQEFWNKLGGDFSKLKGSVDKAKNKKPLFGQKGVTGYDDTFIGIEPVTTATAGAAAASPILLALEKLLKALKIGGVAAEAGGKVVELLTPEEKANTVPIDETGEGFEAADPEPGAAKTTPSVLTSFKPSPLLIGGAAAALVLIFVLTKKKK